MAKLHEQFIVDQNGKKTAVVIPLKDYKQLMEDLHDLSVVAERHHESTISLDELKKRLATDGLIQN